MTTETPGPYSGERFSARSRAYTQLHSTADFVFVSEWIGRSSQNQSRIARIPVVGGSVIGQTPDRDVLLGTGFSDNNLGHRGVSNITDGTGKLFANVAHHASTPSVSESPGLDPDNLVAWDPQLGSGSTSYLKMWMNPYTGEKWTSWRDGFQNIRIWKQSEPGGSLTQITGTDNSPFARVGSSSWLYQWGQGVAFGPDGVVFVTFSEFFEPHGSRVMRKAFVARSDDNGATWRRMDGTQHVGNNSALMRVWDSNIDEAFTGPNTIASMTLTPAGTPLVGIHLRGAESTEMLGTAVARWNGESWDETTINESEPASGGVQWLQTDDFVGIIQTDRTDGRVYVWWSSDDGVSWQRHLLLAPDNPIHGFSVDPFAWGNHGRLRVMSARTPIDGLTVSDVTESTIIEFMPPGLVNARNGTLTAVGGTLTAA